MLADIDITWDYNGRAFWNRELRILIDSLSWITGGAMYLNADWNRRRLALSESRKHTGTWPHHFLVTHINPHHGNQTSCDRCGLTDAFTEDFGEPCYLEAFLPEPFLIPHDYQEDIPF